MTTSVIQALATGLPCITSDHSGFRDQIIDGQNGYIFPENDHEALADAIVRYMNHPELWSQMGRYGREHAKAHYDTKVLTEKQIEIYKSLVVK